MFKKGLSSIFCLLMVMVLFMGVGSTKYVQIVNAESSQRVYSKNITNSKTPKYIFMFIGDGMSHVQVNAAQVYKGNNKDGEVNTKSLSFSKFPVAGHITTYDSTSFAPDSASTATALSSGIKTRSGTIGMDIDTKNASEETIKNSYIPKNIAEILKEEKDWKIGIVSTVGINHATPAAYYAHVPSRSNYYDIAMQLADSNFDYFAGGPVLKPTADGKKNAYEVIKEAGYYIPETKDEILKLDSSSGKVYAPNPAIQDNAMYYSLDAKSSDLSLADFIEKGIDVLDNEKGFFLMAEAGKIDWACHANDAKAAIEDVLAFDEAIEVAVDFAKERPDETLIVVTGDHETGGMTIGYAATGYSTAFDILKHQKVSFLTFDEIIEDMKSKDNNLTLEEVLPVIKENFGLIAPSESNDKDNPMVLTDYEYKKLVTAFEESMKEDRTKNEETAILYGGYNPLSVTLTHILNNKAGIGWTSYAHTGTLVPVYALGAGAEIFSGSYDNTDVFYKLKELTK